MELSDTELMLLEQLTYFGGVNENDTGVKIKDILAAYTDEKLSAMASSGSDGVDRAAMIRSLRNNEKLGDLVLTGTMQDVDNKTLALCFCEEGNGRDAIVTFKGTTSEEWGDNITGFNSVDTYRQIQAKNYIDGLPFDHVTVVGHSKGGNKAMYVSILCDKVNRCIAMDGQGFSPEFIEHYESRIAERAQLIKKYSIYNDYVHELLFQIPGSNQIYCEGFRIGDDIGRPHQPYTFFQIDDDGNIVCEDAIPVIVMQRNGKPIEEDPSVVIFHQFVVYVLNVATPADKEKIVGLLSVAADKLLSEKCNLIEIGEYLFSHDDDLALVVAYLAKFMDTYGISTDNISGILTMFGLQSVNEDFKIAVLIDAVRSNLTDGEPDPFIYAMLSGLSTLLGKFGVQYDAKAFWTKIEAHVRSIRSVSREEGLQEPKVSRHTARFSDISPVIHVDTAALRKYADRLRAVNVRLNILDKRLDKLYCKVGILDILNLLHADLLTSSSARLTKCARYLDETANDFEEVEKGIAFLF